MAARAVEPGAGQSAALVELYWIPLGAGQRVVQTSGRIFERVAAFLQRRQPCALYHSALAVTTANGRHVIEMTPITDDHGDRRGVVGEGSVGTKWAGRLRIFRYEIRCWRNGAIPDQSAAAATVTLDVDDECAQH